MMPLIDDRPFEVGAYTLRPWGADDIAWVFDACQDPEIQRWTKIPVPYTARDAVALYELSHNARVAGTGAPMAIAVTETGELLGATGLADVDWLKRRAEVGYWLARDARGRGVMTTVLPGVARWAHDVLKLSEVIARVAAGNIASERVLERCGFQRVGGASCSQRGVELDASMWRLGRP
jgi:RimJ/RimL family protein N-acetyltransferase